MACNCGNKKKSVEKQNILERSLKTRTENELLKIIADRGKMISNQQLYNSLNDVEKEDFIYVEYLGGNYNHLLGIHSPIPIVLGFKSYGIVRKGFKIWIHKEDFNEKKFKLIEIENSLSIPIIEEELITPEVQIDEFNEFDQEELVEPVIEELEGTDIEEKPKKKRTKKQKNLE